jgi:predicted DNA-binding transcriptional regulator AlpA
MSRAVAWADIVGMGEIADRLGVARTTVWQWRQRDVLPIPAVIRSNSPLWDWRVIERWARRTGRLP